MDTVIAVEFPNQHLVYLRISIPSPEKRPEAIMNFIFLLSGALPPLSMQQHIFSNARALPASVVFGGGSGGGDIPAAGEQLLPQPLVGSSFVRVVKGEVAEFGPSATKTIFGGFTKTEGVSHPPYGNGGSGDGARGAVYGASAKMEQRLPGTIVLSNLGRDGTNGSRYAIILPHANGSSQVSASEYQSYTPIGFVVSGLEAFCEEIKSVVVNDRTFLPKKPVKIVAAEGFYDFRKDVVASFASARMAGQSDMAKLGSTAGNGNENKNARQGKRRAREEADADGNESSENAANLVPGDILAKAIFYFDVNPLGLVWENPLSSRLMSATADESERHAAAAHPTRSTAGLATKRRRGEAIVMHEDGQVTLRSTAIDTTPGDELPVRPVGAPYVEGETSTFNYFEAQEHVFSNDLSVVLDVQHLRHARRQRRDAKSSKFAGGRGKKGRQGMPATSSSSNRNASLSQSMSTNLLGTSSSKSKRNAASTSSGKPSEKRRLNRMY